MKSLEVSIRWSADSSTSWRSKVICCGLTGMFVQIAGAKIANIRICGVGSFSVLLGNRPYRDVVRNVSTENNFYPLVRDSYFIVFLQHDR